jgi:transcription elongation factor Elf1
VRQPIDINKLRKERYPNTIPCAVCNTSLMPIETKSNTVVWYCSKCDLYNEYTSTGIFLRSFKKPTQVQGASNE